MRARRLVEMGARGQRAGQIVHIDAEDGGEEILVDETGVVVLVVRPALVTGGDVEVAVRAEMHVPAVVVSRLIPLRDHRRFGSGIGRGRLIVSPGCAVRPETRHPLVKLCAGVGDGGDIHAVEDVKVSVLVVIRMEGHREDAAFRIRGQTPLRGACGVKMVFEGEEGRARVGGEIHPLNAEVALDDEKVARLGRRVADGDGQGKRQGTERVLRCVSCGLGGRLLGWHQGGVRHADELGVSANRQRENGNEERPHIRISHLARKPS